MAVAVETLVRQPSLPPDISPSPSSSELSECRGFVKLRAVLTGVDDEEDEEEERWEEEEGGEEEGERREGWEESNTLWRAKCPDSHRSRRVGPLQA